MKNIDRSRRLALAAILLLLIFLTACSATWNPFRQKSRTGQDDTPFTTRAHTGVQALVMKFATYNPPRTVYYTGSPTPFNVILELRNRGGEPITNAYLYLSGYDRNIIQPTIISPRGSNLPMRFDLDPVSNFNPQGGFTVIEFENTILRWPPGADSYEPTFRASACYRYVTIANPVVCIDPHPFSSMDEKKVCRVRNIPMSGGQGAPIEVTVVEQESTEQYTYFRIRIKNAQTRGVVFDDNSAPFGSGPSSCPFNIQYNDINKVYYYAPTFTGGNDNFNPRLVECKPDNPGPNNRAYVRLVDNQAIIYCKYANPPHVDEAYQTPLNIKLEYGYLNWEEQKIRIKNAADR